MCKLLLGETEVELKWGTEEQAKSFTWASSGRVVLLALPFLEGLTSPYHASKEVLQLLKITSSLVLSQEQSMICCFPWGHHQPNELSSL